MEEVYIRNSLIKVDVENLTEEVKKSVFKITYGNKAGTGFLIKLNINKEELNCLMTNEHIVTKDMIQLNNIIDINNDYHKNGIKITLDKKERNIIYNEEMDVTIIEIKIKDNLKDEWYLLPILDNYKEFINEHIYVVQYPKGKILRYSEGKIMDMDIDNDELSHDASTKFGSSGSPIIIKNTTKVIGIHKQGNKDKTKNYGTLINSFQQLLLSENKILEDKKNIGDMLNYKTNGKRKLYYKNHKIKYEGGFLNGKPHGNGKLYYENGKIKYDGEFANGKQHGNGILYYKNGKIRYVGEFANGKIEGSGKYIWDNSEYYIGQWLNHKKHGEGTVYYKNNEIKYKENFVNDKREGFGEYIWEDGEYYKGEWSNDHKHGKGEIHYKNKNIKYKGDFANGKKEGKGKYIDRNGNYYDGDWVGNKKNGKGKLYDKNNNIIYEGDFVDDKFQG